MARPHKVMPEADDAPVDVLGKPGGAGVPAEDAEGEVSIGARHARDEPDGPEDGRDHVHQMWHQRVERRGPDRQGLEGRRRERPVHLLVSRGGQLEQESA